MVLAACVPASWSSTSCGCCRPGRPGRVSAGTRVGGSRVGAVRVSRPGAFKLWMVECLVLGRLYEMAHPKKASNFGWSNQKNQQSNSQQKGLLQYKKDDELKTKETNGKMRPFLSTTEMNERRAKGLCYY